MNIHHIMPCYKGNKDTKFFDLVDGDFVAYIKKAS